MPRKLWYAIKFLFSPPKEGDVYSGDAFDFVVGKPIESVLHGMRDQYGNPTHDVIPGNNTYKIKIVKIFETYYSCKMQALVEDRITHQKAWLLRSQDRKISKELLKHWALEGRIFKW
ncbi:MAG: hypothetical protein OIN85_00895 [Candidatus Methanoperedens sp.]|nr:hypothetical protein [Candidatus Methanoperedens sp.]